jgi:cobaltochelatase CobT
VACARLQKCPTRRKILFVLSDGAPVDDSTLSVNPGNFLERHLKSAVNWIKTETDVELYGIGLEHDVSRYYGSGSPTLNGLQVGPDLLTVISYAITNNWKLAGEVQRRTPKRETLVPMRKPRAAPARRKARA